MVLIFFYLFCNTESCLVFIFKVTNTYVEPLQTGNIGKVKA